MGMVQKRVANIDIKNWTCIADAEAESIAFLENSDWEKPKLYKPEMKSKKKKAESEPS